jgi:hypothetical protein
MIINEKHNKKLLVEGNDDQHVVWALCEQFKINETFDVIDCNGISDLLQQIPVRLKQSGIDTVGIIVDADLDISRIWNSLKSIFTKDGISLPQNPPEEGLILINKKQITIGIWIMPNNKLNGILEDFISFLVPPDDSLFPIVNENLNTIEDRHLNKYKANDKSKAIIHSWLAVQEDPGTPIGLSITKRYLSTEEKICSVFISWIDNLFNK